MSLTINWSNDRHWVNIPSPKYGKNYKIINEFAFLRSATDLIPMNQLIALALVIAAGFLLYGLWRDRPQKSSPHRSWKNKSSWKGKISGRLLQAVKGDRALAQRLLENAILKHPGKSNSWYTEKVIYDIERDGAGTAFRGR